MTNEIKLRIEQINRGEVPPGYKKTEVGIVPQEWEVLSLEEVCVGKGVYGLNAPACEYNENLPIYLRITDIDDNGNFSKENIACVDSKDSQDYYLKDNDVLFVRTGATTGKSYLYTEKDGNLVYAGFLIKFSINPEIANSYTIKQLCNTSNYWKWVKTVSARSGQPGINADEYSKYKFALPMVLEEQNHIAEILSKWDDAISLQEELIHKMEIYKELLLKALLEPKTDWKKFKIEQVATKQKAKLAKTIVNGIYPIIDMEYLEKQQFINFTNDVGIMCTKEDVLLLWDGSGAGTPIYNVSGVVGSTFAKLTPNDKVLSGFLYYFLLNIKKRNSILREGSGVPHVPKDFMKMQYIYLPTIDSQKRIVQILETYDATIRKQLGKLDILKKQKKTMQSLLLSGIVRV